MDNRKSRGKRSRSKENEGDNGVDSQAAPTKEARARRVSNYDSSSDGERDDQRRKTKTKNTHPPPPKRNKQTEITGRDDESEDDSSEEEQGEGQQEGRGDKSPDRRIGETGEETQDDQFERRNALVISEENMTEEETQQRERARAEFERSVRLHVFPYIKFPKPTERLASHHGGHPFFFYCLGLRTDKMDGKRARAAARQWDLNISSFHKIIRNKRASAQSAIYEAWRNLGPENRKSLKEYQECREKSLDMSDPEMAKEAFSTFFCLVDTFMRAVHGKSHVSDGEMRTKSFKENMMTDSTEAYVLFVLEDKWEVFEQMEKGKTKKRNKGEVPDPKYTLSAAKCSKGNSLKTTGLKRFGVLHKQVKEMRDREKEMGGGQTLEERVRQEYQKRYDEKNASKAGREEFNEDAVQEMYKDTVCEIDPEVKRAMFRNFTEV